MASSITVPLDDQTERTLSRMSQESGRTLDEIAKEAIERFAAVQEFHRLRQLITPFARDAGFLEEEDVFKEIS